MPKTQMRDIVVILPGITGSVLQKDGKDLWAVSGQAAWQAFSTLGKSLQQLKLDGDDPNIEDLKDGIKATRVVADVHFVPGLVKVDGYTAISRLITDNFQVEQGDIYHSDKPANFFEFPYDWRRDNRVTAKRLKRVLDERLMQWREYTGNENAKVILLAHSMGGLVSRYYLEVLEGWRDCKALITFGTPYRGSINAVNFLTNGYKKLFFDLTEVLRSFPSIYQLLPIYEMLKVGDKYYRIAEAPVELPNIVRARAEDALKFHREIEEAVNRHQEDAAYLKSYKIIPVVGTKQTTLQSASIVDNQIFISSDLPDGIPALASQFSGDGTVPYVSAIPIELSNDYRETYIPEQHGSIQNNTKILTQLRDRLTAMQIDFKDVRGPEVSSSAAKQPAINLRLDDLYLANEAVEVHAKLVDCENLGKLEAKITPISSGGSSLNAEFHQQDQDSWRLSLDSLSAGLYRLTVEASSAKPQTPYPVHALFEVVK
jgi:triacylglycerol esterase/lipase EstA (alpha/beta hydrolase family)